MPIYSCIKGKNIKLEIFFLMKALKSGNLEKSKQEATFYSYILNLDCGPLHVAGEPHAGHCFPPLVQQMESLPPWCCRNKNKSAHFQEKQKKLVSLLSSAKGKHS